jgi:hypothetical protein
MAQQIALKAAALAFCRAAETPPPVGQITYTYVPPVTEAEALPAPILQPAGRE